MKPTSCTGCPSFIAADQVFSTLGISYGRGVAVCGSRGIPLGTARSTSEQTELIQRQIAEACPEAGDPPLPGGFKQTAGTVGSTNVFIGPRRGEHREITNCGSCTYLLNPSQTSIKFGWQVPLCLAKGVLIPNRQAPHMAKRCTIGRGRQAEYPAEIDVDSFTPFPVYGEQIVDDYKNRPARSSWTPTPDPREFKTQLPVAAEDAAKGIRAWRLLQHPTLPTRKQPLYLPVFDPEVFSEDPEEMSRVPVVGSAQFDKYRPDLYRDYSNLLWRVAVNLLGLERTPVLIGHAGTGKTEFFAYLAYMMQLPFERISINRETEVADVMGYTSVEVDPTSQSSIMVWNDGTLPQRWTKPGVLVLDEPNTGPAALWQAIRPVMDTAAQLVIPDNKNKAYERDDWCMFGIAMNPDWDGRYIGTDPISEADGNRSGACWVDFPDEDIERDVIITKVNAQGFEITNGQLDTLMKIAAELRKLTDPDAGGSLNVSVGLRIQTAVALYWQYVTLAEAYLFAIGDRLDPQQRQLVMSIVKNYADADA